MADISAMQVKQLRDATGLSMSKCKDALVATEGDHQKAIDWLRKAGLSAGAKKSDREAKEGMIVAEQDDKTLALLEGNCETDFVSSNEDFKSFMKGVAQQAVKTKPASLAALLGQASQKDPKFSVEETRNLVVAKVGENVLIRRLEMIQKRANSSYGIYSHMGGKLLVVVEIEGGTEFADVAKDVAMHVAATNPEFLSGAQIPKEFLEKEAEIAREQVKGKPANIIDKIVAGKLKAREDEVCLVNQKFVKDTAVTVQQFVEASGKQAGKTLSIRHFWRWTVGQALS